MLDNGGQAAMAGTPPLSLVAVERAGGGEAADRLVLPFALREKARQRVRLASGREAGLFLPRGTVLRHRDLLLADSGERVRVEAADEEISVVQVEDPLLLARIAYHLGNRHVAVRIEPGRISYLRDHVLDEMVRGLGGLVRAGYGPFAPEEGAYHGGGNHHHHD